MLSVWIISLIVLVFSVFYFYYNSNRWSDINTIETTSENHFSKSYLDAKTLLKNRVKSLETKSKYKIQTFQAPVHNYAIDVVVIGDNKDKYLFHTSGVHGVEGYAGSAIQVAHIANLIRFK